MIGQRAVGGLSTVKEQLMKILPRSNPFSRPVEAIDRARSESKYRSLDAELIGGEY
jgi:hypothetical protein